MGRTRKAHRKSRTGCAECRRRRIKCGEEKPTCAHCERYRVECIYPRASSQVASPASKSSEPSPAAANPLLEWTFTAAFHNLGGHERQSENFDMGDLVLLHHWSLVASLSITNRRGMAHLWQTVLPQLGFRFSFLMHGIMSVAALHLAHLDPTRRDSYVLAAARHQNVATAGFREAMSNITEQNCTPVFGMAVLNVIYVIASFGKFHERPGEREDPASTVSRVLGTDWLPLILGVLTVLRPYYQSTKDGLLGGLISVGNWDNIKFDSLSGSDDEEIRKLETLWANDANFIDDSELYGDALAAFRRAYSWIMHFEKPESDGGGKVWTSPFLWLFVIPKGYYDKLRERQPPALILFAYFGVLVHRFDEVWWMEGWGREIIEVIHGLLGPYSSPWMEWPRKKAGFD